MRRLTLFALLALAACGDDDGDTLHDAAAADAPLADAPDVDAPAPDGPAAVAPCLDSPDLVVRAPSTTLPCELISPGFLP